METQHIKDRLQSKSMKHIIATGIILLLVILAFSIGMHVGFSKAAFSYRFGDNYYGTFGPRGIHHGPTFIPNDISPAHGVSGKIVSIQLPTLIVADQDNTEKVVHVSPDTVVRRLRDTISATDLVPGDFIVMIGSPNDKTEVQAKFIRVLPPPPERDMQTIVQ